MKNPINSTLVGVDGNAFMLMGFFSNKAKKAGWTREEIDEVLDDAQSSDYSHLVSTLQNAIK